MKKNLLKQKLMGLGLIIVTILAVKLGVGEAIIVTVPLSLLLIFEKRDVFSEYYEEEEDL